MGNNICGSCYYSREEEIDLSTNLSSINVTNSILLDQFLGIETGFRLEISKDSYRIHIYETSNYEVAKALMIKTQECENDYLLTVKKLGKILRLNSKQQLDELFAICGLELLQNIEFAFFGTLANQHKLKKGIMVWNDKTSYEGDFFDDVPSGFGKLKFLDNSVYEGQFKNGEMHGYGTLTLNSECILKGMWINNLKDGDFEAIQNGKRCIIKFKGHVKSKQDTEFLHDCLFEKEIS